MRRATESRENGCINFHKVQPWKRTRKNVSRSMSQDQGSRESEYATAVLAAAFAIHSLEEAKTPQAQDKIGRRKEAKANGLKPHSIEAAWQSLFNKTKISGGKPSRSFSFRSTPAVDGREKVERHGKLKSVISWANEKKMKAKHKIERTKS